MDSFGDQVRLAREARGWSQDKLAEAVGTTQSTIDRIESGITQRSRVLPEVTAVLGLAYPARKNRAASEALVGSESQAPPAPAWAEAHAAPEIDKSLYPRDVPLIGIAACGDGDEAGFTLNGQTGDYVRRPPGLEGKRSVYALNLFGTSMYPVYRHGALVYVDPRREPGPDEDALIELHPDDLADNEPGKGYVKRVVSVRGSKITCKQFNPPVEVTFDRADVKSFHRVIPWEEVLGY